MKKFLSVLGGAAVLTTGLGIYISERIMHIRRKDQQYIIDRETKAKRVDLRSYDELPKEEVFIESPFGYPIKAVFVKPFPASNQYMIFCHGVTENKMNSIKYMNIFLNRDLMPSYMIIVDMGNLEEKQLATVITKSLI